MFCDGFVDGLLTVVQVRGIKLGLVAGGPRILPISPKSISADDAFLIGERHWRPIPFALMMQVDNNFSHSAIKWPGAAAMRAGPR